MERSLLPLLMLAAAAAIPAFFQPNTQCKKVSYDFCCELGTPCDCTKGTTSPGQCEEAAYAFCCSIGTSCDCTQPPLGDSNGEMLAQCTTDADCPCSYCMNDSSKKPPYQCHADTPGVCCTKDSDCPGSYCVDYHGPPPYHCHATSGPSPLKLVTMTLDPEFIANANNSSH
eukprot:TRINITY_DN14937_c0_g1_i13.p1 TRINITY_DN14937_c0_g1~~TRINITY_DN14937_c0_g1_i13.p1  ORF type:complete len:171 (+),score=26.57 TRINITY_DN14937_c0_g1_i13:35-547(+)